MREAVEAAFPGRSLASSIVFAALLAACGSSDDGGEEGGGSPMAGGETTARVGFVFFAYPPPLGGSAPFAFFRRLADEVPFDASDEKEVDACIVERGEGEEALPDELIGATSIDAGEALTFRNAGGPYYVMARREDGAGGFFYRADGFLPRPVPEGLTLDVPGGEFPAFADIPFPDVEPLTGATTDGRTAAPDTAFTWDAGSVPGATIDFQMTGEAGGVSITILCELVDDGEFSLPAATRAEVGADFAGTVSFGRSRVATLRDGDALLVLTVERDAEGVERADAPDEGTLGGGGSKDDARFLDAAIPSSARAARVGLVEIVGADAFEDGAVFASFYGLDRGLFVDRLVDALLPPMDTCRIRRGDQGDGGPLFRDEDGSVVDVDDLDAGETITFTGPDGTWLTLPRRDSADVERYSSDLSELPVPSPVPSGLVLDIPGADYPGFANVALADVAPLVEFVPAVGRRVTGDTSFVWTPGGDDPTTFVGLVVFAADPNEESLAVFCAVRDDGEFTLPAATMAELDDDFPGTLAVAVRVGVTSRLQGDALLIVVDQRPPE